MIDWKDIKGRGEVNGKFNLNSMNRLREPFNYTEYNEAIIHSREDTAMTENSENHGWFHFSCDTITPTLETRNSILHSICADAGVPSPRTLRPLEALQHKVDEAVDIVKTR